MDKRDSDKAFDDVLSVTTDPSILAQRAAENKLQEDALSFYEATLELNRLAYKDPSQVEKLLDNAGGACAVRKLAEKASQSALGNWGSRVQYSFEVNRARDEETLIIGSRDNSDATFSYTQSPACKPADKIN